MSDISEVGVAAVRIIPVMAGFSGEVSRQIGDGIGKAAKKAGDDAGKQISKGVTDAAKKSIPKGVSDAAKDAGQQAGEQVTKGIADRLRAAGNRIGDALKATSVVSAATKIGSDLADGIRSGIMEIRGIGDQVAKAVSSTKAVTTAKKLGSDIASHVTTGLDELRNIGDKISGPLKKALSDSKIASAAKKVGSGIAEGISSGVSSGLDSVRTAATKVGDVFTTALTATGVAAGALLVTGLTSAMDAEVATDRLAAQLGNAEFGERMGAIAGEIYVNAFGDSVGEVGDVLKKVWRSGLVPEDAADADIQRVTEKLLTFTDVMEQDVDMATQAISNMIRTGIADSSEESMDILTRGVQQGADRAGDLMETFQEFSTMFRDIGISAEDATGLMVQGLGAGARDATTVADALKEVAIRAQDGSKTSAEGFRLLGLNAEEMTRKFAAGGESAREGLSQVLNGLQDMEDPVERNAAAVALFGTKAEDLGDALFAMDLDTAASRLGDFEGALQDVGDTAYDNAATKIESFKRGALMRLTNFVGGRVIPLIERLAAVVGPPIQAAFGAARDAIDSINWDRISFVWQTFIDALTGTDTGFDFAGWVGTIQDIGTALNDAYNNGVKLFFDYLNNNRELVVGALTGIGIVIAAIVVPAIASLVAGMVAAAAPFILIALAAAALGAGLVWLYNNVETFRNFVQTALPLVVGIFSSAFELIKIIVGAAIAVLSWIWDNFGQYLIDIITIAWDLVSGVVLGALNVILGLINFFVALFTGDWSGMWDAVKQIASGAWQIIWSIISAAVQLIWVIIQVAFTAIVAIIKGALTLAWNIVKGAWSLIKSIFSAALSGLVSLVSSGISSVVGFFQRLPGQLRSAVSTIASALTSPFRSAFNSIKSLWNRTVGGFSFTVPDWIPGVGGKGFSIPTMHSGGIVPGPVGSDQLILAQGGEGMFTRDQMAAIGTAQRAGATPAARLTLDVTGADRDLVRIVQKWVRVNAGGDAQLGLGTRRRTAGAG